jgi:hypothetical protein
VADEDRKRALHQALVDRVLGGEGRASAQLRGRAFRNEGLSPPVDALVHDVVTRPAAADLDAAKAAGLTEDEIFELVICAAVGHSARLYAAGRAALASVSDEVA